MQSFPKYKIFAVGDIHGCHRKLTSLIERLPLDAGRDFLVFLYYTQETGPGRLSNILSRLGGKLKTRFFCWEIMNTLCWSIPGRAMSTICGTLRFIGVEDTLNSYSNSSVLSLGDLSFLPAEHTRFLETLGHTSRSTATFSSTRGPFPENPLDSCPLDRLLTVRERFLHDEGTSNEITVFGHTPFETPFVTPDKIGIDTGAAYGNLLTAVELPGMHFYHS